MLVLSRRTKQQIVFPHLGITLSVLQVSGNIVKLGVDAPESIKVLRQEICGEDDSRQTVAERHRGDVSAEISESANHRRRNELNVVQLKLEQLQRRIDRGELLDAECMRNLLDHTASIDREFNPAPPTTPVEVDGRPVRLLVVEDCDNERQLMAYVLAAQWIRCACGSRWY